MPEDVGYIKDNILASLLFTMENESIIEMDLDNTADSSMPSFDDTTSSISETDEAYQSCDTVDEINPQMEWAISHNGAALNAWAENYKSECKVSSTIEPVSEESEMSMSPEGNTSSSTSSSQGGSTSSRSSSSSSSKQKNIKDFEWPVLMNMIQKYLSYDEDERKNHYPWEMNRNKRLEWKRKCKQYFLKGGHLMFYRTTTLDSRDGKKKQSK